MSIMKLKLLTVSRKNTLTDVLLFLAPACTYLRLSLFMRKQIYKTYENYILLFIHEFTFLSTY